LNFPITIEIGSTKILLHAVLELAAFFTGFRYFILVRKKKGDINNSSNRSWLFIGAVFGAFIGSRLLGGLEDPTQIEKSDNIILYFYQNKTVVGGLLGGLLGVEIIKKFIGEKKASGDLFVYPFLLALIIGRIGCFSMGIYEETYGNETNFFTGMNLGDGRLRHPVTLYEIVFLIILWVLMRFSASRISFQPGALFKIFMISYLLFRFLIDFIKPHYTFNFGMSAIQVSCLAGLIYYSPYIVRPKKLILSSYA
jgi:prolipoprotein diacylglyceryltransferase